jgi:D-amino peptidase
MRLLAYGAALAAAALTTPAAAQKAGGYRIFISVDMEGIAGAVTPSQITPGGNEYEAFRRVMTGEVIAAIEGAREAGATEFVVADSHGSFQNVLIDQLPAGVTLVRGEPRPLMMMDGVDQGRFDGVMFIGYHSSASNTRGVRAHTISSARLSEVKLNGAAASEGMINAAIAGQFGAPVILVTGDDAVAAELAPLGAENVVVKRAIGFHAAQTMTPADARDAIRAGAKRAVGRIASFKPSKVAAPTIDISFHYYRPAEMLAWLPGVERTGARAIRFRSASMADAARMLEFITNYTIELEP